MLDKMTGRLSQVVDKAGGFPERRTHEAVIRTRVNQSFFRAAVLAAYNVRCCVTGLSIPELLTASHIVPWSADVKNRTNPRNGLCLNPSTTEPLTVVCIAHQIRVPEAFLFGQGDAGSDDHCFHELDSVQARLEAPNDGRSRSISQFIAEVNREAKRGWMAFDPHDRLSQRITD